MLDALINLSSFGSRYGFVYKTDDQTIHTHQSSIAYESTSSFHDRFQHQLHPYIPINGDMSWWFEYSIKAVITNG